MKVIASVLVALSVLAAAGSASAADCAVKGWSEGGQGGRPVFECPQS
jgi:hypothetical protein